MLGIFFFRNVPILMRGDKEIKNVPFYDRGEGRLKKGQSPEFYSIFLEVVPKC